MNKVRLKYYFIVFLLLIFIKGEGKTIDRDYWRDLKRGLNYDKNESSNTKTEHEDWWSEMERRMEEKEGHRTPKDNRYDYLKEKRRYVDEMPSAPSSFSLNIPPWVSIIGYIILGALLAILIYFLFFKTSFKKNPKIVIEEDEVLPIHQTLDELELALSNYLKNENYREAIRVYFIFIVKELRDKNWIKWESKKTNHAFLFEMRNRSQYESFSEVILFFEIIWFGKREINKEQYQMLQPKFQQLLNSIKSTNE